jgi:hypothetical protein
LSLLRTRRNRIHRKSSLPISLETLEGREPTNGLLSLFQNGLALPFSGWQQMLEQHGIKSTRLQWAPFAGNSHTLNALEHSGSLPHSPVIPTLLRHHVQTTANQAAGDSIWVLATDLGLGANNGKTGRTVSHPDAPTHSTPSSTFGSASSGNAGSPQGSPPAPTLGSSGSGGNTSNTDLQIASSSTSTSTTSRTLLQTFTLQERYGVSHPTQIVDFDLGNITLPKSYYVIGPNGKSVPFQVLSNNRIAVETSLAPYATANWQLYSGRPPSTPSLPNAVKISQTTNYYQITNGLTGVRIPVATTNLVNTPAPVQGIQYRDGHWSATGPNYLSQSATSMSVQFLERGPLKTVIQVSYTLNRPAATDAQGNSYPAGVGHYTSTITLEAGQPSALFEEDTDTDVSYSIDAFNDLNPDQARYRGHNATTIANGYTSTGQLYGPPESRPIQDAFTDLQFNTPKDYQRLAVWNPWVSDSGWYWQLYNSQAASTANMVGIFAGPSSQAIGAANSGVNLFTAPEGVTDLVTQSDGAGGEHTLYQRGDHLWYLHFGPGMQPGTPQDLGAGLTHANMMVSSTGTVSIIAFDQYAQQFVQIQGTSQGSFSKSSLNLGSSSSWQATDSYAYQTQASGNSFLITAGQYQGQSGLLLFVRTPGATGYSFQQWISASAGRQINRPNFTTLADGRVALVYTDTGGYAEVATIQPGALDFGSTASDHALFYRFRLLNFGSAIDSRTGNIFVADNTGALNLLQPVGTTLAAQLSSTPLGLALDHHGQGPNRRSIATDAQGNVVAVHGGSFFLYQNGVWSPLAAANSLGLFAPRVDYDAATGNFVFSGRSQGKLTLFTWKVGDATPVQIQQIASSEQRGAGFKISMNRRSPDARFFPHIRFSWGLFAGVKGTDLLDPLSIQPIARQMNLFGGINLDKVYRYNVNFADPPQGYGALYMDKASVQRMINRLRTDKAYYDWLWNAEPTARDLISMWTDTTGAKTQQVVADITGLAKSLLDALVNGDGIYNYDYSYWMGGLQMSRMGLFIDSVLASDQVSAADKANVKAAAALFANVLWDDDFVPMQSGTGLNLGTANMPVQEQGYRDFYALFLSQDPDMSARAQGVGSRALATLDRIVNTYGAEMGSSHYISASIEPTLNTLLQVQMLGGSDPFQTDDRLTKFAEFYMNLLSPQDSRFGGERKVISIGDASTESSEIYGILATGFRKSNPQLSARLQGAWIADGRRESGFFGTSILKIDDQAPAADPNLGNANFPGYYSVLRNGWGTSNETSMWFVNGDFYRDHRHNDQGSLVAYALGAPLSLNWGGMYYPQTPGAAMASMVMPLSQIPWNQDSVPLTAGNRWTNSTQDDYLSFTNSGLSTAHFTSGNTVWTRSVYSIHPIDQSPILLIRDSFANATEPMVFSMNLMAQGDVSTPDGMVTPPARNYANGQQLPSLGSIETLNSGVNRFGFTGQWGVNFDLYTMSDSSQQARIGNWSQNWNPTTEQGEFKAATGQSFQETQDTFRLMGSGPFDVMILPYQAGQRPADMNVTQSGGNTVITANGGTTTIGNTFYSYQDAQKSVLTAFGSDLVSGAGMSISGGSLEAVKTGNTITLTVDGAAGLRTLSLDGNWQISPSSTGSPITYSGGSWQIDYQGGSPLTITLTQA